jgi:hypothetical protein
MPSFQVTLHPTYYNKGFINPPVALSHHIAAPGAEMIIRMEGSNSPIQSTIGAVSKKNCSPRLYGRQELVGWFQKHFRLMDTVNIQIVSPNEIRLRLPRV